MGAARQGRRPQARTGSLSTGHTARVIPSVPTFSVDPGFWYSIPHHLEPDVAIGRIVRVPLGGRRVRGYVVEVAGERPGNLKDVLAVSGEAAIFDSALLQSLTWASQHYVAPLSVLLEKAAPPTLPGELVSRSPEAGAGSHQPSPVEEAMVAAERGRRRPVTAFVTHWADAGWQSMLSPFSTSRRTALIVVPTFREAESVASLVRPGYGDRVILVPDGNGSDVTRAWEAANGGSAIVVGTPRTSFWMIRDLAIAIVFEEARRAMKERQTPTVHVRDLLRTRSRLEAFNLLFVGPTPSVELIAAGAETVQPGRPWGLVEVIDRREDPPGSGYVSDRAMTALRAMTDRGGSSFVFTHIRAGDASMRCVRCRAMRLCSRCGSHLGRNEACPRCGTPAGTCRACGGDAFESMGTVPDRLVREIGGAVGRGKVGEVGEGRPITVGTERDLAGLADLSLAVAVDTDALLHGQNYRSSEEALRILARLVGAVGRGRGYRTILQTSDPDSGLMTALRRGEPIPYLEAVLARRARDGFPPASEMMAIEASGVEGDEVTVILQQVAAGMVLGPVAVGGRQRWLLQGDLGSARSELRRAVQKLRDSGATIRVDVDPIDL